MKFTRSGPFEISEDDLAKIMRGALIATAGAVITWAGASLIPALESETVNIRSLLFLLSAAWVSAMVNAVRKLLADNT